MVHIKGIYRFIAKGICSLTAIALLIILIFGCCPIRINFSLDATVLVILSPAGGPERVYITDDLARGYPLETANMAETIRNLRPPNLIKVTQCLLIIPIK